jgi:hypothetical protein
MQLQSETTSSRIFSSRMPKEEGNIMSIFTKLERGLRCKDCKEEFIETAWFLTLRIPFTTRHSFHARKPRK